MKFIHGGVTSALGFKASGIFCGIKKSKKRDLSLIYSEKPCEAAGTFTSNKVQASCVVINKEHLRDGRAQAVVANSGNANCLTGESGFENSRQMASQAGRLLKLKAKDVLVASTGVIGKPLPIKKMLKAFPDLVKGLDRKGGEYAAAGILTTDRMIKQAAVEFMVGRRKVRVGAIAKGAGMIHPGMQIHHATKPATAGRPSTAGRHATMLCFATTDAEITQGALREALDRAVQKTFNSITIDGDMSTNDMVLVLANGASQNKKIAEKTKEFRLFTRALEMVFMHLAELMVKDAEGATKFVEIFVKNALNREDAKKIACSVAKSSLVKCALFGSDPNWGRIAAAAGYSGAHVDPWKLQIHLGRQLVLRKGGRVKVKAAFLNRVFAQKRIKITVDLGLGGYNASYFTCDLSTNYVRINSAYRT